MVEGKGEVGSPSEVSCQSGSHHANPKTTDHMSDFVNSFSVSVVSFAK